MRELNDGVSVVIPTYDRPDYLTRLLKSIVVQTRPVDEVIIVNDHSSDQAEYNKVIDSFSDILKIRYFVTPTHRGAPFCRNYGIEQCNYKYIALTDDDDEWEKNKTEKEYECLKLDSNVGLVYTKGIAVDDGGEELYKFEGCTNEHDLKAILRECFIPSSSVMVKYDAIKEAGLFDEHMPSCQDWDMWTRIINHGFSYCKVNEYLLVYHKHNRQSVGKSTKARKGYTRYYRKHLFLYIKYFLFTKEYRICLHAIKKTIH